MDESISPGMLNDLLGASPPPTIVDVRQPDAFDAAEMLIVGARRRAPGELDTWRGEFADGQPVVVYCAHGKDTSQTIAEVLRTHSAAARYLEGGIARWIELGLPTRRKIGDTPGRWVTRERPTIDRIACPWLIWRFIDPAAEFLYVRPEKVRETASQSGATSYDIADVEFGHRGNQCSFDAFIRIYCISDPALDRLATIVRGADTSRPELAPQSAGLLAISQGLKANFTDDHAMLAQGQVIYNAHYAWCRQQVGEARR
jgi:rhodanese-related sulfurtransferase